MSSALPVLVVFASFGIGLWLASYLVEALRRSPPAPQRLRWAPDIPIDYIDVGGYSIRYIKTGHGPNLILLHTLRTQLDLFEKVVLELAKHFTVYAFDFPGHGYSGIPRARYDAPFFVRSTEAFLDALDLRDVTLAGVSIGGTVSLVIAGRRNPRIARIVAINPYDYAKGRGIARSSLSGRIITVTSDIRVVGEIVMRLRNFNIVKAVLRGGVVKPESIPSVLLEEMYAVGNRHGHYQGFISLLRNAASWERATEAYSNVSVPVRLVWGDKDWAKASERERDRTLLHGAKMVTVEKGGHFLPLDRPDAVIEQITLGALPTPA